MTMTLREVTCAIAFCAFAIGAQAQSTDTSKMASPKGDMASKVESDYKSAKAACDAKSGAEKDKCMKDADEAHAKAMKGTSASSQSKDTSSGSMKGSSSSSSSGQK
jgi:hyperosmotically inducible periplasmic protein